MGGNLHFYSNFNTTFFLANNVDTDQTPRPAASDLGLHCLHVSEKGRYPNAIFPHYS